MDMNWRDARDTESSMENCWFETSSTLSENQVHNLSAMAFHSFVK